MSRKLFLVSTSIFFSILNPIFASSSVRDSDYVAVLTGPNEGMTMLEAAQDAMLVIYNDDYKKMLDIAAKAASGCYTREQLDKFDIKFQKLKHKMSDSIYKQTLGEPILFNQGNFSIVKNNNKYVIDLSPKNTAALGLSDDNLLEIDSAKTAANHINAAIDNLNHWLPEDSKDNSIVVHTKKSNTINSHMQTDNYFDSYKLYIKTPLYSEFMLKTIKNVRNQLLNLLSEMALYASRAASDVSTPADRMASDTAFRGHKYEIDDIVNSATFSNIEAYNENMLLVVHNTKYGDKAIELPRCIACNIMEDDVITPEHADKAVKDLANIRDRLGMWFVDGAFNTAYVSSRIINPKCNFK